MSKVNLSAFKIFTELFLEDFSSIVRRYTELLFYLLNLLHCFGVFQEHIFNLMKSDSYSRYLRSEMYKEYVGGAKKKVLQQPNLHFHFHFASTKSKGEG